ncbi:alpha-L-glutamate ligase [Lentzea tibetensis]|uniref:Alpha-L-glutamate ligase n=1 Tax=Lentzea tibetensis TaxID=2591470 RepID=A0A563EQB4_9PSEU|nr:alpha-L-glutamate ligase [Lentzea tibetensis]TWP49555.1 alpha-L-glutamate ligase [Lentzea tibetensis]
MTDHSSTEGSRATLVTAVETLTGRPPVQMDARHFMTGGIGRVNTADGALRLEAGDVVVTPSVVLIYEIPPGKRRDFEAFQRLLEQHGVNSLGLDADASRTATEKNLTVDQFVLDNVPHMETISLSRPTAELAADSFDELGGDVWARPVVGMGGDDVFHVTSHEQLRDAADYYATSELDWLIARDANNVNHGGLRHQYRVVVLEGRVVRACEHVQANPDAPCNEIQGAVSTVLDIDDLPAGLGQLAVSATKSLGLAFGGVDLALENGGVVFEVNVHPAFGSDGGLETVAIPYVEAHLAMLS